MLRPWDAENDLFSGPDDLTFILDLLNTFADLYVATIFLVKAPDST